MKDGSTRRLAFPSRKKKNLPPYDGFVSYLANQTTVRMNEGFVSQNPNEASIHTIAEKLDVIRAEIAKRYGVSKGNAFFSSQLNALMLQGIRDYYQVGRVHSDTLVNETGTTLKAMMNRYGKKFSTKFLEDLAEEIEAFRPFRKVVGENIATKTQAYFAETLRPVDVRFREFINSHDTDAMLQYIQQDPEGFQTQLAYLKQRGQKLPTETSDWIFQSVVSNYEHLPETVRKVALTQNEQLAGLNGLGEVDALPEAELQRYAKVTYALRTTVLLTAQEHIEERATRLTAFFNDPSIQNELGQLSVTSLDNLSRYVIQETQVGQKNHSTEKEFDVEKPDYTHEDFKQRQGLGRFSTPRKVANQLVHLPVFQVLRDKLLSANPDTGFTQTLQMHDYYSGMLGKYYINEKNDIFWGTSVAFAEELAPLKTKLLESFGSFDYLTAPVDEVATYYNEVRRVLPSEYESGEILNRLATQIVERLPFDNALQFMEAMASENNIKDGIVNRFIEKRVNTLEDYRRCKDSIARTVDAYMKDTPPETGIMAAVDTLVEAFAHDADAPKILETLLLSGGNDTEFRRRIAPYYLRYVRGEGAVHGYEIRRGDKDVRVVGSGAHTFRTFEEFIDGMQGLGEFQKMNILRKVFLAENGILQNPDHHKRTVDMFMSQLEQDSALTPLLRNIMSATLNSGDPVRMFLPIANSLTPFILRRPPVPGENGTAAREIHEYGNRILDNGHGITDVLDQVADKIGNKIAGKKQWTVEQAEQLLSISKQQLQEGILSAQPATAEIYTAYQAYLQTLKESLGFASTREAAESNLGRVPPIEIVLRFGQAFGPVGKRFLQVLPQRVPIPLGYRERFREVNDANPGQSKYSAFAMIDNEAKRDADTKRFVEAELVSVDEKIGGGSIMTTFGATTRGEDGQLHDEVLKVKNPNAERFVIETVVEARKVIEDLTQRDPKNATYYVVAGRLLDTIESWVLEDIRDETFMQLDPLFAAMHDGYQTKAGPVIEIGRVGTPNNANLKREIRMPGDTVNKQLPTESRPEIQPDAKRAVSAIAEDFARQLTEPAFVDANGRPVYLIHSDIHPGNEIVSPDGSKVHPIDRNYYLQLSKEDVEFVHTLLTNTSPQQQLGTMVSYFLSQPENASRRLRPDEVSSEIYKTLYRSEIVNRLRGKESTKLELVNRVLQELERRGVEIPLRFSILNKNLDSVNHMLDLAELGTFLSYFNEARHTSDTIPQA